MDFCGCGSGKRYKKCCQVRLNAPFIGPELPPPPPLTAEEKQAAKQREMNAKLELAMIMAIAQPAIDHFGWQDRMLR